MDLNISLGDRSSVAAFSGSSGSLQRNEPVEGTGAHIFADMGLTENRVCEHPGHFSKALDVFFKLSLILEVFGETLLQDTCFARLISMVQRVEWRKRTNFLR